MISNWLLVEHNSEGDHGCAAETSEAIVSCYHVSMD